MISQQQFSFCHVAHFELTFTRTSVEGTFPVCIDLRDDWYLPQQLLDMKQGHTAILVQALDSGLWEML